MRSHQHSRPDLNDGSPQAVPTAWDPQSWGAASDKSPMKGSESPLTVVAEDMPGSPNYRSSPRARSPAPRSPEKGKSVPDPEAQMWTAARLVVRIVVMLYLFLFIFFGEECVLLFGYLF